MNALVLLELPRNGLAIAFIIVLILLLLITLISVTISNRVKGIQKKQEIVAEAAIAAAEISSVIAEQHAVINDEKINHISKLVNGHHHWLKARVAQLENQLLRLGVQPELPGTPEP